MLDQFFSPLRSSMAKTHEPVQILYQLCLVSSVRIQSKSPPKTPWKQQKKIVESPKPEETFHEWKKIRLVDEKKS